MKKIFITLALALACISASAQTRKVETRTQVMEIAGQIGTLITR